MKDCLLRYAEKVMNIFRKAVRPIVYRLHGLFHRTVTAKTRQGILTMFTRDDGIGRRLFRNRQYEFDFSVKVIDFLKREKFIPTDGVCMLDVGANIGVISTGLLLSGHVEFSVAIEPEPSNFELLTKNVQQNGLSGRMICLPVAMADKETTLHMELAPNNPGDHRIRSVPVQGVAERLRESTRQTVPVKAFPMARVFSLPDVEKLGRKGPSFVWIDVQGYEGYAFDGGRTMLSVGVPTVSEIWPYGILRAGMPLEKFVSLVQSIWSDYWVQRRGKFVRYPIAVFDRFLAELGTDGAFENVIFTKGQC